MNDNFTAILSKIIVVIIIQDVFKHVFPPHDPGEGKRLRRCDEMFLKCTIGSFLVFF